MESLLIDFVNTLDSSLKKMQERVGEGSGFARLTISQLQYIDAIYELREPTITEIAHRLNVTKASVTAGINKLVKGGYVMKTRSNEDKRVFHISLTRAGERLVQLKHQALRDYEEFILEALSDEESRQFHAILAKLVTLFEEE